MTKTYTTQTLLGLELTGLSQEQLDKLLANAERINFVLRNAFRHELNMMGIRGLEPRLLSSDELRRASKIFDDGLEPIEKRVVGRAAALSAVYGKDAVPGTPLRQFVRGFLRDHLGFSKIVAHTMADLFMARWKTAKEDGTAKRYAEEMEDKHTLAATFDREAIEMTDDAMGITAKVKSDIKQGKVPQELLRFPDRATGFDPRSRLFAGGSR